MHSKALTIQDRVYLERVKLFFGHAVGNLISAVVGGAFIALILEAGGVSWSSIVVWFSFVVLFAIVTGIVEKQYSNATLSTENAAKWVTIRSFSGALIALMYGLSPFVFSQYLGVQEEMFLFIVLSAMVSIALVGYTIMPFYYTLLNFLTLTPLTIYFLLYSDSIHIILATTAVIWQFFVISKGWMVSKSSINAIVLNEQLQDEIKYHKETKEKLHELATHDILTGVPNRRLLMENLESMFALAHRNEQKIIIMFIDLDGFKVVNDNYGHEAGDFVLQEIASRLKLHIRKSDTLARMGGDEFVLGFGELDDINMLAERIISSISEQVILPSGKSVEVGASIGVAFFPDDGETPEDVIRVADARMYRSKIKGKNRYTITDD